jgi:hypothetical protein
MNTEQIEARKEYRECRRTLSTEPVAVAYSLLLEAREWRRLMRIAAARGDSMEAMERRWHAQECYRHAWDLTRDRKGGACLLKKNGARMAP